MGLSFEGYPGTLFSGSADPGSLYLTSSIAEAMASILHGVRSRRGIVTLTGPGGTGKTTLLRRVADQLDGEAQFAFVVNPPNDFEDLLLLICNELGVSTDDESRALRMARLNERLLEGLVADRNLVVMIDDAHLLPESVLEQLRLLTNLETAKEKLLQVVLCGQPELLAKLAKPALRQLRQRVAVWATVEPLTASEAVEYVAQRFHAAGLVPNDFFHRNELELAARAARGIPRTINIILDNALILGFARGEVPVSNATMMRAVRSITGRSAVWSALATRAANGPAARVGALALIVTITLVATAFALQTVGSGGLARALGRREPAPAQAKTGHVVESQTSAAVEAAAPTDAVRQGEGGLTDVEAAALARTASAPLPEPSGRGVAAKPPVRAAGCGDGVLDRGEECDDANDSSSDACLTTCREAVCGDGVLREGFEECDDANAGNEDGCLFGCILPRCGDGYVFAGREVCDDGNTSDGDRCAGDCTLVQPLARAASPPPRAR